LRIAPDEITKILKERIESFEKTAGLEETGRIVQVGDAIAKVYGLKNVKANGSARRCLALPWARRVPLIQPVTVVPAAACVTQAPWAAA